MVERMLTTRTHNCFRNCVDATPEAASVAANSLDFATIVSEMSKADLLRMMNFGKVCLFEVEQWLASFDLSLSTKGDDFRQALQENRERAELARLKSKYEGADEL